MADFLFRKFRTKKTILVYYTVVALNHQIMLISRKKTLQEPWRGRAVINPIPAAVLPASARTAGSRGTSATPAPSTTRAPTMGSASRCNLFLYFAISRSPPLSLYKFS
jgi:hypothetical protein